MPGGNGGKIKAFGAWCLIFLLVLLTHGIAPPKRLAQPEGTRVVFEAREAESPSHGLDSQKRVTLDIRFDEVCKDWLGSALFLGVLGMASGKSGALVGGTLGLGVVHFTIGWFRAVGNGTYFLWWLSLAAMAAAGGWMGRTIGRALPERVKKLQNTRRVFLYLSLMVATFGGAVLQATYVSLITDLSLLGLEGLGAGWDAERFRRLLGSLGSVVGTAALGDPEWFFLLVLLWPFSFALAYLLRVDGRRELGWVLGSALLAMELGWFFFWPRVGAAFGGLEGLRPIVAASFVGLSLEQPGTALQNCVHSVFARPEMWTVMYFLGLGVPVIVLFLSPGRKAELPPRGSPEGERAQRQ